MPSDSIPSGNLFANFIFNINFTLPAIPSGLSDYCQTEYVCKGRINSNHEVPDQVNFFNEIKSILKPGGKLYIIEPRFHVSGKSFDAMIQRLTSTGFEIADRPGVFFSRAVLLTLKKT